MQSFDCMISRKFIICSLLTSSLIFFFIGFNARVYLQKELWRLKTNSPIVVKPQSESDIRRVERNINTSGLYCNHNSEHVSSRQHMFIEFRHVQKRFLQSEDHLLKAISKAFRQVSFPLLSYHCQNRKQDGIHCVTLFSKGTMSIMTDPKRGYISFDFYTFHRNTFLSFMMELHQCFINNDEREISPEARILYKVGECTSRYRLVTLQNNSDKGLDSTSSSKKHIMSELTERRRVDIYDVSVLSEGNINNDTFEEFSPLQKYQNKYSERNDRLVFFDNILKTSLLFDETFHEALVHPGMFSHINPSSVAIIANGDSAIIREVLKHESVNHVSVFDIEDSMISLTSEYLCEWQDCSDIESSEDSCFDDTRVRLNSKSSREWFTEKYLYTDEGGKETGEKEEELFDIIILNAYEDESIDANFFDAIFSALTDNGVLMMTLGRTPRVEEIVLIDNMEEILVKLEELSFESLNIYEEVHADPRFPLSFLVACKNWECRENWYANQAEVDFMIFNRLDDSISESNQLKHFDGATMMRYQTPPKIWESIFCGFHDQPTECKTLRGLDPNLLNFATDQFEIKESSLGENAGRGVFARVDVPKGSLIMQEQAQHKMHFTRKTMDFIEKYLDAIPAASRLSILEVFMDGYGFQQMALVEDEYFVDSCPLLFVNHGCNGTQNVHMLHGANPSDQSDPYFSEASANLESDVFREPMTWSWTYNIVIDRHLSQFVTMDVASHNILAGEELFSNYLLYNSEVTDFSEEVANLRAQCTGLGVGVVRERDVLTN